MDTTKVQKVYFWIYFAHENIQKTPSKLCITALAAQIAKKVLKNLVLKCGL